MHTKEDIEKLIQEARDLNNPFIALKISLLEVDTAEWLQENYIVAERMAIEPVYVVSGW